MNIQSSLFKIRNDFYDIYIFFFTDLNRRSNHTCHFFFTIRAIGIIIVPFSKTSLIAANDAD